MKTLEEIKNDVAEIYLYHDFKTALDLFQKGVISQVTFDGFLNQIVVDACKEALKNASEKMEYEYSDYEETPDFYLILNESNIPKL